MRVLLESGADPFIKTKWRETAEDLAKAHKQYRSLQVLQEHGKPPLRSQTPSHTVTESVW